MKYEVLLDERRMVGIIRFHGACSLRDHCDARDEVAELMRKHSARRVLVDLSDSVFPEVSSIQQYSFAESLSSNFEPKTRIAAIVPASSRVDFSFPENVAFNRGILLKTFRDKSEADAWLFEKNQADSEIRVGE